jgi:hypothetical protein
VRQENEQKWVHRRIFGESKPIAQHSCLAGALETWDEQKWVRQMKSAQFAPDAELEDLA